MPLVPETAILEMCCYGQTYHRQKEEGTGLQGEKRQEGKQGMLEKKEGGDDIILKKWCSYSQL